MAVLCVWLYCVVFVLLIGVCLMYVLYVYSLTGSVVVWTHGADESATALRLPSGNLIIMELRITTRLRLFCNTAADRLSPLLGTLI